MRLISSIDAPMDAVHTYADGTQAACVSQDTLREMREEIEQRGAVGVRFMVYNSRQLYGTSREARRGGASHAARLGQTDVLTPEALQGVIEAGSGGVARAVQAVIPCDDFAPEPPLGQEHQHDRSGGRRRRVEGGAWEGGGGARGATSRSTSCRPGLPGRPGATPPPREAVGWGDSSCSGHPPPPRSSAGAGAGWTRTIATTGSRGSRSRGSWR